MEYFIVFFLFVVHAHNLKGHSTLKAFYTESSCFAFSNGKTIPHLTNHNNKNKNNKTPLTWKNQPARTSHCTTSPHLIEANTSQLSLDICSRSWAITHALKVNSSKSSWSFARSKNYCDSLFLFHEWLQFKVNMTMRLSCLDSKWYIENKC